MSCSHASSCPLFPKLQQSLAGWRSAYCDTAETWLECARYQKSLKGQPVPLALLPNGKVLGIVAEETGSVPGTTRVSMSNVAVAERTDKAVAVLDDLRAEEVLEQAKTQRRGFFSRLRALFGASS